MRSIDGRAPGSKLASSILTNDECRQADGVEGDVSGGQAHMRGDPQGDRMMTTCPQCGEWCDAQQTFCGLCGVRFYPPGYEHDCPNVVLIRDM